MASKIEDYGFISNLHTGALVSRDGTIDWLCPPDFDADACFAALVGYDEHGSWAMRPTVPVKQTRQKYRGDTLILETEFECEGGKVRIVDFMPVEHGRCDVIRILEGVEGTVPMEVLLNVRFGYGANVPWIQPCEGGFCFTAGPDSVTLRTPAAFEHERDRISAVLQVKQGERIPFALTYHPSYESCPAKLDHERALAATEKHWSDWAGRCTYQGPYRDAVLRSLLTLKGLTYWPTGGIIAALTTSLPEELGGVRNWDYRFCWLRDASLTLDALMIGGYKEEATAFRAWLQRAVAGEPEDIQIMYNIRGARRLTEFELPWLPGYEGSKPVRVGNAASDQFQLDVYGETLSALYAGRLMGIPEDRATWPLLSRVMQFIEQAWQRPDDGIWEVRGGRRHFTHSKIMAWVAIDRAIKAVEKFGKEAGPATKQLPHMRALRERIHSEVCQRGFNPKVGAFTQSYGSDLLDASVLVMTHYGFLPASDPRVAGTVAAIEKTLLRDGFVLRYATEHGTDGLPGTEGAFLACSFWLADNYAFAGKIDKAEAMLEKLLSLRNHLGLLAEEYEPKLQRQVGNFPQAFSHLALIMSAYVLGTMRDGKRVPQQLKAVSEVVQHQVVHH